MSGASAYYRVFQAKNSLVDKYFRVHCSSNGTELARIGLAISRRSATRAVDRNRIKRIIRESFRAHKAILAGLDIIVQARFLAKNQSNHILFAALAEHWAAMADQSNTPQSS